MIATSSSQRRGLLIMLALVGALATAGCKTTGSAAGAAAGPAPAPAATVAPAGIGVGAFGAPEPTAAPATLEAGPTKIAVIFPATAQAYAEAVVAAWKQGKINVLGSLTTPGVQEQMLEIPEPLNDAWTFLRCDGTAGSSYCLFANADGDELTLRISHALLGQAHAAIEVKLDQTEYPDEGVAYVKEFVGAWQVGNTWRMLKLSKQSVVDQLGTAPVNPSYPEPVCCGGGLLQVKVQWAGSSVRFDVGTTLLGGPHAIVGYAPPQLGLRQA
jgi:hypothetical protein